MPAMVLYRRLMGTLGISYLLDDEFTDIKAAGALNNTPAVPGPGTRTVVDTNSIMSTAGGVLVVNGTPALNDRYYLGSIARAAGIILKFSLPAVTNISASSGFRVIWSIDGAADAGLNPGVMLGPTGTVTFRNGFTTQYAITGQSAPYSFALIQRGSVIGGGWVFMLVSGQWLMMLIGGTNTTSPLFPKVLLVTGAYNLTLDLFRVPQSLYIPPLLVYDTFTRANGAIGSTESAGPDGQTVQALAWTGSTWTISTNAAVNTPTPGADVVVNGAFAADTDWTKGGGWTIAAGVATATAASSDLTAAVAPLTANTYYSVTFDVPLYTGGTVAPILGTTALDSTASSGAGKIRIGIANGTEFVMRAAAATLNIDNVVVVPLTLSSLFASVNPSSTADVHIRVAVTVNADVSKQNGMVINLDNATTPANFIVAYLEGQSIARLDEWVAGVRTSKISASVTYSAGALLYVIRRGTSAWLFYNNAQVGSVQTMTANTNKLFGLFSTTALCSLDAFEVWPDGGNGEHATLGAM